MKLNRRMRRLQREAEIKAMPIAYSQADNKVTQENLSCKWSVLQHVSQQSYLLLSFLFTFLNKYVLEVNVGLGQGI